MLVEILKALACIFGILILLELIYNIIVAPIKKSQKEQEIKEVVDDLYNALLKIYEDAQKEVKQEKDEKDE